MAELEGRMEKAEGQLKRVCRRVDELAQPFTWVALGFLELEAAYVREVEGAEGGGWPALKRALPAAMARGMAAHVGCAMPESGGVVEVGSLAAALFDWRRSVDGAVANVRAVSKREGGVGRRVPGNFVLYMRPGEASLHAHALIERVLDRALTHASGRPWRGEGPPAPPVPGGRVCLLFPEKTDLQRERAKGKGRGQGKGKGAGKGVGKGGAKGAKGAPGGPGAPGAAHAGVGGAGGVADPPAGTA